MCEYWCFEGLNRCGKVQDWDSVKLEMEIPVNIRIHHGGQFVRDPVLRFSNGEVEDFSVGV
ncbi:conserved hypothetical protein [Ricinus communis]|uniref:Uncharacterized protein n=1 Tax=Ricinus communis TaxID=3988 RepID=B9SW80_RICCO|nr:conserved hypothetical protein [Ricinus communis]